jgi:chromosome segregation ATPase
MPEKRVTYKIDASETVDNNPISKNKRISLQKYSQEVQNYIQSLKAQFDYLKKEFRKKSLELEDNKQRLSNIAKERDKAIEISNFLDKKISKIQKQLGSKIETNDYLTQMIHELQSSNKLSKNKYSDLKKIFKTNFNKLSHLNNELEEIRIDLQKSRNNNTSLISQITSQNRYIKDIEDQKKILLRKLSESQQKITFLKSDENKKDLLINSLSDELVKVKDKAVYVENIRLDNQKALKNYVVNIYSFIFYFYKFIR